MPIRIALDAMGGDGAPSAPVAGAALAAREWGYEVQLVGRQTVIETELAKLDLAGIEHLLPIIDAPEVIEMNDHPASAVRSKRNSSMAVAVRRVKDGSADCFVSAGNTGGVLATALLGLRRIEGITSERPALAALFPTLKGDCVFVDAGANVDCKPEWLAQFAAMGSVYAEFALGKPNPTVATLSIGEEEGKGNSQLEEAVPLIRAVAGLNYTGNVEGKDVMRGGTDVVVVDGFAGNIFVKGAEGTVEAMTELIRRQLSATLPRKLLAAGLRPAFREVRRQLSYEERGGVPLLGVNGVCIVAHGRSTPLAMKNAVRAGAKCVEMKLVDRIRERLSRSAVSSAGEPAKV